MISPYDIFFLTLEKHSRLRCTQYLVYRTFRNSIHNYILLMHNVQATQLTHFSQSSLWCSLSLCSLSLCSLFSPTFPRWTRYQNFQFRKILFFFFRWKWWTNQLQDCEQCDVNALDVVFQLSSWFTDYETAPYTNIGEIGPDGVSLGSRVIRLSSSV